ncbi:Macrolide export ATP-binding/permease protein MacB [Lacunisphaera limnophila]|uniref:Macrolide export ATP-binding/permease protein MacB n=1 Tax=Lacunisphaera limnophila TaxID=1838286 RepID=A0A1D8AUM5_9BACT|nr:ABC transporter permease [Lacunisphaera limnophila]AOS44578.1 Macrolide export ATP-binding/permease protein MacB [Lacunisphaera limnophila]
MISHLRLALRSLARSRGFALIAVFTLAVGIGSTTAIFSTLQALVIAPFSYPASDRLVHVWSGDGWPLSPADSHDLRTESASFTAFGIYQPQNFNIGQESSAQSVSGAVATADVLKAFGVAPLLGRGLEPADEVPGAPYVVILSHALWRQLHGDDRTVIGRKVRVNGGEAEIIGVMPAGFEFASPWMRTEDCQLWAPRRMDEDEKKQRDSHYLLGVARLKEGVTVEAADAEIKTIGRRLTQLYPNSNTHKEFLVRTLHDEMTREVAKQVWLLFGAVVLVLLVACGNVASMLLARSARRQGEFGVRVALGASRGDLLKLALTESAVLALAGAALGVALAAGGVEVLRAIAPVSEARRAAMALNGPALGFGLLATALTALLAGLPPALAAMRTSVAGVLRADARGAVGSASRHRMLRGLVIAQVAVAFVLANGAVLFSQAYLKIVAENRLLATDAVVTARVTLNGDRYAEDAERVRFWQALVERVRALPGVTHAAVTSKLPLQGGSNTNALVNDQTYDPTIQRMQVERSSVTEDYFAAMGLRLLRGRLLQAEDRTGEIRGVVVNQACVDQAWPGKDPLGEIMRANQPENPWFVVRVVGVVENVKQWSATQREVRPEMYTAPEGHWGRSVHLVLRSPLPAGQLAPLLRRELAALDGELALRDVRTMRQVVERATQGERAVAVLVNFFMATALGLVAVGLYGTLSYSVQQRTREIGVRVAVGALKGDIVRLVFTQGGRWVVVGLALGLAGSVALSSALQSLVYGMDGLTVLPLALAMLAVGVAALLACWLPARRAAMLDPLEALRAD